MGGTREDPRSGDQPIKFYVDRAVFQFHPVSGEANTKYQDRHQVDRWELSPDKKTVTRIHVTPRKQLFSPKGTKGCPVSLESLDTHRTTHIRYEKSQKDEPPITDEWDVSGPPRAMPQKWTGYTKLAARSPSKAAPADSAGVSSPVWGRTTAGWNGLLPMCQTELVGPSRRLSS